MRVFERIGRMMRADAHGVMDQLEERSLVIRQSLREAELAVESKRAAVDALDEERRGLREAGRQLEVRVAALDADVELARAGDDDALTRYAVRRLLPARAELRALFARAAELDGRRARLAETLASQEAQLTELRPRVRARLARPASARSCAGESAWAAHGVTDEEVELELLRRRRQAQSARAAAPPSAMGTPGDGEGASAAQGKQVATAGEGER